MESCRGFEFFKITNFKRCAEGAAGTWGTLFLRQNSETCRNNCPWVVAVVVKISEFLGHFYVFGDFCKFLRFFPMGKVQVFSCPFSAHFFASFRKSGPNFSTTSFFGPTRYRFFEFLAPNFFDNAEKSKSVLVTQKPSFSVIRKFLVTSEFFNVFFMLFYTVLGSLRP